MATVVAQRVGRRALRRDEVGRDEIGIGPARHRLGRQHERFERALVDQAVDHAGRNAGVDRDRAFRPRETVGERLEHAPARGGHALRRRTGEPHADALARGAEMLAHAQRHAQHHAARRQRVVRHPVDEAPQLGLERRHIELMLDILDSVVEAGPDLDVVGPDHAGRVAGAERNRDEVARLEVEIVRHAVGIGVVERDRHQHVDEAIGHGSRPVRGG